MMSLSGDEVHVWYFDSGETTPLGIETETTYIAALSDTESRRYQRLQIRQRRQQYLWGKFLLRQVLSQYADRDPVSWNFVESEHGKPSLADESVELAFNLSHSRGMFTVALTAGAETGIDVELATRSRRVMALARRHFAPAEITALERLTGAQQLARFYQLWTLNEAFVKGRGLGLTMPLQDFTFEIGDTGTISFIEAKLTTAQQWQFWTMQLEGLSGEQTYTTSLAVANESGDKKSLRVFEFVIGGEPVSKAPAVRATSD